MWIELLLMLAAFAAGVLNAVAGGGSFITFPALVYAGIPPIAANATSAVAVFPGYLSAALGFFDQIKNYDSSRFKWMLAISLAGGLLGGALLILTPAPVFASVVPWLLLFATALFAFSDRIASWSRARAAVPGSLEAILLLLVCIYGGYFNGGMGIVLLAALAFSGMRDLHLMNGLKNALSFALSAVSVAVFAIAGLVEWYEAVLMMVAATAGGYAGARLSKTVSPKSIKAAIIAMGLMTSLVFFYRSYHA